MAASYILNLSCPDKVGIVASVANFLSGLGCNILDSAQFGAHDTGTFFMRVRFDAPESLTREGLSLLFRQSASRYGPFGVEWEIFDSALRPRLLIMVSRSGHCLNDLLHRQHSGLLPADIAAVVSNHPNLSDLAAWYKIPFHHLPVSESNPTEQDGRLREIIEGENVDTVVLARYMRLLSPQLCADLHGRCINIHHSFLPSFKGAQPYRQAYEHGVKLIGATAHYVTPQLDEGPIIEQDVQRVDHAHTPEELAALGRDVECVVLSRALQYHLERRVLINGRRTVILR